MTGVRYRTDTGFEGKCDRCLEWWPLNDVTCWSPSNGLKRCRACIAERQAERNRIRRQDPAQREADRLAMQAKRHATLGDYRRAYYRDHYRLNRERINELARARYAARKQGEATKLRKRDWMRAFRARQAEMGEAA